MANARNTSPEGFTRPLRRVLVGLLVLVLLGLFLLWQGRQPAWMERLGRARTDAVQHRPGERWQVKGRRLEFAVTHECKVPRFVPLRDVLAATGAKT